MTTILKLINLINYVFYVIINYKNQIRRKTMNTFFIGDLHFGHHNIIEYSKRPFANVQEMDEALIKNWNSVVHQKDEVYILGDFSLTGRQKTEEYLAALKGRKYLIKGNHDYWVSNSNCRKYLEWIKDYHEFKENGRLWVLCHYPLWSWNKRNAGSVHLHAHTHKYVNLSIQPDDSDGPRDWNPNVELEFYNRYMCVSAELINHTPISLEELRIKFKI